MLFENDGRGDRRLEAMRGAVPDHAAEAAERLAALFAVVGKLVQPALDGGGRAQSIDDTPFRPRQPQWRRDVL